MEQLVKFLIVIFAVVTVSLVAVKSRGDNTPKKDYDDTSQTTQTSNSQDTKSSDKKSEKDRSEKDRNDSQDKKDKTESWMLTLVNKDNYLPENFEPDLDHIENGWYFDSRASEYLKNMLNAARADGQEIIICSSYRSIDMQKKLYDQEVLTQQYAGYSYDDALEKAKTIVAYPGSSEHNLGLAADIVALNYQMLVDEQADQPENKWLQDNCYRFGFILRYPKDKTDITDVIYEPWHFRYVGIDAATEIYERGICLEEYLS